MHTIGFSLVGWLHLLSAIFLSNIIWNLLFGLIADRIGWIRTISVFGGVGCALSTLAIYYVPIWHHSYITSIIAGACYGATLAAYVPLSALMTSLFPRRKREHRCLYSASEQALVSRSDRRLLRSSFGPLEFGVLSGYLQRCIYSVRYLLFNSDSTPCPRRMPRMNHVMVYRLTLGSRRCDVKRGHDAALEPYPLLQSKLAKSV